MPGWATGRRTAPRRRLYLPRIALFTFGLACAALLLFGLLPEARFGLDNGPLVGPVERVADGDTLEIEGQRIRLVGMDAPEWDQTCRTSTGAVWPCGRTAAQRLRELVRGGTLGCAPEGHERYGRLLALCRAAGVDIAETLVREGLAVSTGRYANAERAARGAQQGLWQGDFETPAAWRRGAGRGEGEGGGNPSRFERFMGWIGRLFGS